jgi:hypothetical protein
VEIKYIPKAKGKVQRALEKNIQQLRAEGEEQLKKYSVDEKFNKTLGKTTVVKLVLIFCGSELEYIGESLMRKFNGNSLKKIKRGQTNKNYKNCKCTSNERPLLRCFLDLAFRYKNEKKS